MFYQYLFIIFLWFRCGSSDVLDDFDLAYLPWPEAVVPYHIFAANFSVSELDTITMKLGTFSKGSCLKFVPILAENAIQYPRVLYFVKAPAQFMLDIKPLSEEAKRSFGDRYIYLNDDLMQSPLFEMLVMLELGFPLEHNRMDRFNFIDVHFENVMPDYKHLFEMDSHLTLTPLRFIHYDIGSVLHFSEKMYSVNGFNTIVFKDKSAKQRRGGLTDGDYNKIDVTYGLLCRKKQFENNRRYSYRIKRMASKDIKVIDKSLRVNPDITPPPNIDDLHRYHELFTEVGIDQLVKEFTEIAFNLSSIALEKVRDKHCEANQRRVNNEVSYTGDVLGVVKMIANFAKSLLDNVKSDKEQLCSTADSIYSFFRARCEHPNITCCSYFSNGDANCVNPITRYAERTTVNDDNNIGRQAVDTNLRARVICIDGNCKEERDSDSSSDSDSSRSSDESKKKHHYYPNDKTRPHRHKKHRTKCSKTRKIRTRTFLTTQYVIGGRTSVKPVHRSIDSNETINTLTNTTSTVIVDESSNASFVDYRANHSSNVSGSTAFTSSVVTELIKKLRKKREATEEKPYAGMVPTTIKHKNGEMDSGSNSEVRRAAHSSMIDNDEEHDGREYEKEDDSEITKKPKKKKDKSSDKSFEDMLNEDMLASQSKVSAEEKPSKKKKVTKERKTKKKDKPKNKSSPEEKDSKSEEKVNKDEIEKHDDHEEQEEKEDKKSKSSNESEREKKPERSNEDEKKAETKKSKKPKKGENDIEPKKSMNKKNEKKLEPFSESIEKYERVDKKLDKNPRKKHNTEKANKPTTTTEDTPINFNLPPTVALSKENKEFYDDRKWAQGMVLYVIDEANTYNTTGVRTRLKAVNDILTERTCTSLREIDADEVTEYDDYVVIDTSADFVTGRVGKKQVFGSEELFKGDQHRQHAAMMAMAMLGFYWEVARHDRHDFIKIHTKNIRPDKLHHFERLPAEATLPISYDYESATHPSWKFWRKPGYTDKSCVATFKDVDPDGKVMRALGQHEKLLSDSDILKINSIYGVDCFRNPKEFKAKMSKHLKKKNDSDE